MVLTNCHATWYNNSLYNRNYKFCMYNNINSNKIIEFIQTLYVIVFLNNKTNSYFTFNLLNSPKIYIVYLLIDKSKYKFRL